MPALEEKAVRKFLGVIALCVTLTACGSDLLRREGEALRYIDYAGEPVAQISALRPIDGWTPVSRNQLVIWTGMNEAWLLRVWDNCPDLMFVNGIRVTRTLSTISRFEKVMAGRDACPIQEIRPIDTVRMKADRKAARDTTPQR